jgi:hypothetical protein
MMARAEWSYGEWPSEAHVAYRKLLTCSLQAGGGTLGASFDGGDAR